ncbi:Uncharacterised protein [Chlamydia trachomatis]|nr:Uncharacterised protein [Chlamydia trachomatis]
MEGGVLRRGNPNDSRHATYLSAAARASCRILAIYRVRSVTEITPRESSILKAWEALMTKSYAGRGRPWSRVANASAEKSSKCFNHMVVLAVSKLYWLQACSAYCVMSP